MSAYDSDVMAHITWYAGISAVIETDGRTWYVAPSADDDGYLAWTTEPREEHKTPTIDAALTIALGAAQAERVLRTVAR